MQYACSIVTSSWERCAHGSAEDRFLIYFLAKTGCVMGRRALLLLVLYFFFFTSACMCVVVRHLFLLCARLPTIVVRKRRKSISGVVCVPPLPPGNRTTNVPLRPSARATPADLSLYSSRTHTHTHVPERFQRGRRFTISFIYSLANVYDATTKLMEFLFFFLLYSFYYLFYTRVRESQELGFPCNKYSFFFSF